MRNLLPLIILIFSVLACKAQSDTTYIVNQDGQFFEVTQIVAPIGDTSTIENLYMNRATDAARQFSEAANVIWNKPDFVSRILDSNSRLMDAIGKSVIKASVERFGNAAAGDWEITLNGNPPVIGTITVPASNNFLQLQAGPASFQLYLVGDSWIRLNGYPTSSFTDLFRVAGAIEFRSIDESVIFKKQ